MRNHLSQNTESQLKLNALLTNSEQNKFEKVSSFQEADNSTDDLEVRVTVLEDDVTDLQDEVEELETDNTLQDERFNTVEGNVAENSNDIDGKLLFRKITQLYVAHSLLIKLKSDNDNNHAIPDLGINVAETEDLISVLDGHVTELDVLVSTLQEENAQLQQTVDLLLQRVAALEATDTITNNTLDGNIVNIKIFKILSY